MLSRSLLLYKLKALAFSLGVFVFFGASLWLLTRFYLYPDYLFWRDGGFQGLRLVMAVDLILGPLMTFIIYNPAKPRRELLLDVTLLAVIQFSAMAWGAYQVWEPRPVAVVYGADRFVAVTEGNIERQDATAKDLRGYGEQYPPLVYRREPQGEEERARFLGMMFTRAIHPEAQVWLYEKFEPNRALVFARSADVLRQVEATMAQEWKDWLETQGKEAAAVELAFFEGRYGNAVVVFAKAGEYLGYLPWAGEVPPVSEPVAAGAAAQSRP